MRGTFSASTKLWASDVTSMPEPLPSLLIIPAFVLAALVVLVELDVLELDPELPVLLVVAVDPTDVLEDDETEVTIIIF